MSRSIVVNPNLVEMEYAVRGPIPQRAAALRRQGRATIPCNIGNPQALGQPPLTFYRQILCLVEEPSRIARDRKLKALAAQSPSVLGEIDAGAFPSDDVLDLSEAILSKMETGTGAYTESRGPLFIREAIARYIDRRDCVPDSVGVRSGPDSIFLTNGASEGARRVLELLIADGRDGVMIPIPQYPLYSATVRKCGGVQVSYYPNEDAGWTLERSEMERALTEARRDGVCVKAIVVINPGNPTGAILSEESVEDVVRFAAEHDLAILADEVYQDNLYGGTFVSFARALGGRPVPLFSLHSTSKGFCGECGHRGGYLEVRNPPAVRDRGISVSDVLLKQASVSLCANTIGQILTYLMVCPPAAGTETLARFERERDAILDALHEKAVLIRGAFEEMEGVRCFGRIGAMYLFPRLDRLPAGTNDFDYCMNLLETTGLCTVNGAGFGQRAGTHHLRIAFLPPKELLAEVLPRWIAFHRRYVAG
ncbi:MAG: aminotransferase class I/II-fold pyridoxal phosphate-dependent enzyme [Phycisphaerae bacterium]